MISGSFAENNNLIIDVRTKRNKYNIQGGEEH